MVFPKFSTAFVLTAAVIASPLAAQDHRVQIAGYAGALTPLSELGQVPYPVAGGTTDVRHFLNGISFGGNATLWLDDNLGIRADVSYAGSKVVEPIPLCPAAGCTNGETAWTKIFIGGDIVLRKPTDMGMAPYAYFGAGLASMSEKGSGRKASRPIGRVGAGLNYTPSQGALGFFGELGLIIYDFDQTRFTFFDKVQTDLALRAGVSFAF